MTHMKYRQRLLAGLLGSLLALWTGFASGADESSREYQIKAAFLYHFAKFVEWPARALPGPSDALSLCILGRDPFGPLLDETLAGKTIQGRPLAITRHETLPPAQTCHMLFISASKQHLLEKKLAALAGAPVLTIGDTEQFASRGGMIELYLDDNTVRFKINRRAAKDAGLTISSHLLKLATLVPDQSGN